MQNSDHYTLKQWKCDDTFRAVTFTTRNINATAMHFGNIVHDGQPQTGTFISGGIKRIENFG